MKEEHSEEDNSFQVLPALSPEQEASMEKEYRSKLLNFYTKNSRYEIDYWYAAISEFTYRSFCFPLSAREAYVLHCLYYEYKLDEATQKAKDHLIDKIDQLLEFNKNEKNMGKFFMKLSTRSPKDYCWDYRDKAQFDQAVQNLKEYLQKEQINSQTSAQKLSNVLYRFFLVNSHKKLQVRGGQDFTRIFSKSERIITDINDYSYLAGGLFEKLKDGTLDHDSANQKLINVWVREWDDCQWQQEFRTFYHDYKLTAISQYDQRCFFPGLANRRDQIAQACQQMFDQIKPSLEKIGLDKGVLDIVIKPNETKVVEINVYDRDARASLFNWTTDEALLQNGPLQVRVLEKQVEISKAHLGSIMGMIDKMSLNVITDALSQLGLLALWK